MFKHPCTRTMKLQLVLALFTLQGKGLTTSEKTFQLLTTREKIYHFQTRFRLKRTLCNTVTSFVMTCAWRHALSWCTCHS